MTPPSGPAPSPRPTRLVTPEDAPVLAALLTTNRAFLAPWEPLRDDDYFTVEGQRGVLDDQLADHADGLCLPHVILDEQGVVVGRITLTSIVRGAFQSCSVGYWVGAAANGRGFATSAVADIKRVAFDDLGLHRIQGDTLLHNVASQRVLERNGFERFGVAPRYLCIAGQWQDFAVYQVLAD